MPTPNPPHPNHPVLPAEGEIVPQLEEAWQVQEYEFQSEARWVGKLVAQFRTAWNNVASRWSVRHAIAQQNYINLAIRRHFHHHVDWLVALEKENIELRHQLAELEAQIKQLHGRDTAEK